MLSVHLPLISIFRLLSFIKKEQSLTDAYTSHLHSGENLMVSKKNTNEYLIF